MTPTLYRAVPVSERLPKESGDYIFLFEDGSGEDRYFAAHIDVPISFKKYHRWLEPISPEADVSDSEIEMQVKRLAKESTAHASRLDAAAKDLPGETNCGDAPCEMDSNESAAWSRGFNNCREKCIPIIADLKQQQEQGAIGFGKFVTDFFSMRLQVEEIEKLHAHYLREKQKGENTK